MQAPRRAPNGALDVTVAPATAAPEPGRVPAKPLKMSTAPMDMARNDPALHDHDEEERQEAPVATG